MPASKPIINGTGKRKLESWIDSFVEATTFLSAPAIFRRWSAISTVAAALEQKCWINTGGNLYPNLYVILISPPGIGKSRSIKCATSLYHKLPEPLAAPTSMTMAALVDIIHEFKRIIIVNLGENDEYNSAFVIADELSAFMHQYDREIIAGLTTFYDSDSPYSQARRVKEIRIAIKRPQLNILAGTTPVKLGDFIPETAWGDGFTSRIIMVYSNEVVDQDIFAQANLSLPSELQHDLELINKAYGQFGWDEEYAKYMNAWQAEGFKPVPEHPKLETYNTRRRAHIIKLSMISAIDRGSMLQLTKTDFNKAMNWLMEAEHYMPQIFQSGNASPDSQIIDEVLFYIKSKPDGMPETKIMNYIRMHVKHAYNVRNFIPLMEQSGLIKCTHVSRQGVRTFQAL